VYGFTIRSFRYSTVSGYPIPADYRIEFYDTNVDTSIGRKIKTKTFKAYPVNYKVYDKTAGKYLDTILWEQDKLADGSQDGVFTAFTNGTTSDRIVFLDDTLGVSYMFELDSATNDSLHVAPAGGDVAEIKMNIPFLHTDTFEFTTYTATIDQNKAKQDLKKIKVVPNPYIVANSWEPENPYSTGRGPRELHFNHLPEKCTIRIFNIRGQLVRELEHDTPSLTDGTEVWDMQTRDNLDIAYGVYIYHIDAGELGEIVGKFAVIK
jgi:hypothetical protein